MNTYNALLLSMQKTFVLTFDNSIANSHNINIDYPTYTCFALNKEEAIGKMMLSDFTYKNKAITNITYL